MYLNNSGTSYAYQPSPHPTELGFNPNMLVPPSEAFTRCHSDAKEDLNSHFLMEPVDSAGVRMKRYNSLPDVAEYLDPMSTHPSVNDTVMANPQLDSLMAAFNQNNRKMYSKDMFLDNSHLQVPMTNVLSTSSNNEIYHNTPPQQSPRVQQQQQPQQQQQYGWVNEGRSPQPFYAMPNMSPFPDRRKRPNEEEMVMAYPNMSPQQFMPNFKRMRQDPMALFDQSYLDPNMYPIPDAMSMPMPLQPGPAPDSATAQAARDAIQAASHCPPPSDDSGDPDQTPRRQHLRYPGDLYTPQWVRGTGHKKEGYCDLCSPGKWLQLKNSAYWYHKQFFHGISSVSGKFFCGPVQTRQKDPDVVEGLCHQCHQWVQMSSAKRRNSVLWFRHAHKCHVYHKPKNVYGKKD